jgi:hypothetical protein
MPASLLSSKLAGLMRVQQELLVASIDESLIGVFQIKSPTIALCFEDGRHISHTLPVGTIVKVVDGRIGEKGLLDVIWEGRPALMFAVDLKARGTKVRVAQMKTVD